MQPRLALLGLALQLALSSGCGGVTTSDDAGSDDAGDVGAADAVVDEGPVLRPDEIFGDDLCIWLDADDTVTFVLDDAGGVQRWTSKGAAKRPGLQAHQMEAGILRLPTVANGHFAVRVGPANGTMSGGDFGGGVTLVAMVAAYTNSPGAWGDLLDGNLQVNFEPGSTKVYAWGAAIGVPTVSATGGWNDGRFHSFGVHLEERVFSLRTDGMVNFLPMGPAAMGLGLELGGEWADVDGGPVIRRPLDGHIAELIVVSTLRRNDAGLYDAIPVPEERVDQLSRYFQQKYGIPF